MRVAIRTALTSTILVGLGFGGPAPADDNVIPDGPGWHNRDDFVIGLLKYEAGTKIDYGNEDEPGEHFFEMKGWIKPPRDLDVVCVAEALTVREVIDDERDDILVPQRRRRESEIGALTFSPVLDQYYFDPRDNEITRALIEVDEVEIRRPAYVIDRVEMRVEAVIAKRKETVEIPAIVTDNKTRLDLGVTVRLSSMTIEDDGTVKATVQCERGRGTGQPILDAMFGVDDRGRRIGGGRWVKPVEVFAEVVEFEAEFLIDSDADIDHLELVFVTQLEIEEITFEIDEIFQE
ncbi:MAG: hypothetical protein AAGC44_08770 [Planctomycetota bacterium]